jgi:hypothetical protein
VNRLETPAPPPAASQDVYSYLLSQANLTNILLRELEQGAQGMNR